MRFDKFFQELFAGIIGFCLLFPTPSFAQSDIGAEITYHGTVLRGAIGSYDSSNITIFRKTTGLDQSTDKV